MADQTVVVDTSPWGALPREQLGERLAEMQRGARVLLAEALPPITHAGVSVRHTPGSASITVKDPSQDPLRSLERADFEAWFARPENEPRWTRERATRQAEDAARLAARQGWDPYAHFRDPDGVVQLARFDAWWALASAADKVQFLGMEFRARLVLGDGGIG